MQDILDAVYEYQRLFHKEESLGIALTPDEDAQRTGLRRLLRGQFAGEEGSPTRGTRLPRPRRVQLTVSGGFRAGELRNVSAGGVAVVSDDPPPPRSRSLVQVFDDERRLEFVFPGRVVWGSGRVVGIAFDGMPSREPMLRQVDVSAVA